MGLMVWFQAALGAHWQNFGGSGTRMALDGVSSSVATPAEEGDSLG